jgi:hypothetical protein
MLYGADIVFSEPRAGVTVTREFEGRGKGGRRA